MPPHLRSVATATKKPLSSKPLPTRGARFALGAFFSMFFAVGATMFYVFCARPAARILAARDWRAVSCEILSSGVQSSTDSEGSTTYRVDVRYRYFVDDVGHVGDRYKFLPGYSSGYSGKAAIVNRLRRGTRTTCWVNPDDAEDSVLERGFTAEILIGLIPLIFAAIGAGGMYAAIVGRRTRFINAVPGLPDRATVPVLAYASLPRSGPTLLKPRQTRRAKFIGFVIFALFWNGIVAIFLTQVVGNWRNGIIEWGLTLFMMPFVLVGAVVVVMAVWHGMLLSNPRPLLTVSSDAVPMGDEIRIQWGMDGSAEKLTALRIALEGREEATYTRGTDTRTDKHVFAKIPVIEEVSPVPAQGSRKITIPADTMHSFDATNNKIVWSLRVHGEIPNWPDSDDEFAFIVLPQRR